MNASVRRGLAAVLLALLAACSARVDLVGSVPEEEANEALGALLKAGLDAEKVPGKDGMVGIRVGGRDVSSAVTILKEQGLPRERFAAMGDVFRKEGLVSSPMEERARYVFALSQELSETISRMDGVVLARVHVVLAERTLDGDETSPATAAVFVKTAPQARADGLQGPVKRLVANAIPGLTQDRVSLVVVPAVAVAPQPLPPTGSSTTILSAVLATVVALAGGAGFFFWRRRKAGEA